MLKIPDIQFAVHSCARFSTCTKQEHEDAVEFIAKNLKGTSKIGMLFYHKKNEAFKVYADADCSGNNWLKKYAECDPAIVKFRLGWILNDDYCPILWASKMQSKVALNTTEAAYIALSLVLGYTIPLIEWPKSYMMRSNFTFFSLTLMLFAMALRITLLQLKLLSFERCIPELSMLTFTITI